MKSNDSRSGKNTKVGIFCRADPYFNIENSKYINVYANADWPSGRSEILSVCPIVRTLQISGESSGRLNLFIIGSLLDNIVINELNNNPTKYMKPLKSWLKIEANVKKDANTNGAKRKNR